MIRGKGGDVTSVLILVDNQSSTQGRLLLVLDFPIKYKCNKKLIDNKNPKSNFEKGLSILIQSVILDCNPGTDLSINPIHQHPASCLKAHVNTM